MRTALQCGQGAIVQQPTGASVFKVARCSPTGRAGHALELSAGAESCVKCRRGRVKGESLHKFDRLGCSDHAVHAGVFPLYGEGAVISDGVEHAEAVFPWNVTVTGGDEVPAAARVSPG